MDFKEIEKFIKDYYEYTTEISITENEYFGNFEWLESWISHRKTTYDDYVKEGYKDMLYDLIFNQNEIKRQIENDLCNYDKEQDIAEIKYIKKFYETWKHLFNFKIEDLEV